MEQIMETNSEIQNYNIIDKYKHDRLTKWTKELIKKDLQEKVGKYIIIENIRFDTPVMEKENMDWIHSVTGIISSRIYRLIAWI